jgi:hypothetical protein
MNDLERRQILRDFRSPLFCPFLAHAAEAATHGYEAWRRQPMREKLAVALVLNKTNWLQAMNYSIADAIDNLGPDWVDLIPCTAKRLRREGLI